MSSTRIEVAVSSPASAEDGAFSARSWTLLLGVVLIAAVNAGILLKSGWVPHDEGAFAVAAAHARHGELPHRDFQEIYTGGLTLVNAAAMRVFGVNMAAMRYPMYAVFLVWVAVVFAISRRFEGDWGATMMTLLMVAISYPNYRAAVPSWYNLFLATFGILALFRFAETRRLRWVFVAGVLGGLSFLVKVSGLYFLAAALCWLLFYEQDDEVESTQGTGVLRHVVTVLALVFALLVWRTIGWSLSPRYLVHFVLPSVAVVAVLVRREFRTQKHVSDFQRITRLVKLSATLLIGALVPVLIFLIPYVRSGSISAFMAEVFQFPFRRLRFASYPPERLENLLPTLVVCAVMVYAIRGVRRKWTDWVFLCAAICGVAAAGRVRPGYHIVWSALTLMVPCTVVIALGWMERVEMDAFRRQRVFLLVASAAICGLVRFPFASPVYLLYVLPLAAMVWVGLVPRRPHSRLVLSTMVVGYILFFTLWVTSSPVGAIGIGYKPSRMEALASEPAGGLRVPKNERDLYDRLTQTVLQHVRGEYIYAGPDCPQVYFLSGTKQADRAMFDFLDETDATGRTAQILNELEEHKVNVVVIDRAPSFSPPMEPSLHGELAVRYPHAETTGDFEVRWAQ